MKKAQAAMEFMMTYGWAILVVLAAIGALAYFGVLSPSKHIPETCMFQQGIACVDYAVASDEVSLFIRNGYAKSIDVKNITAGNCDTLNVDQRLTDLSAELFVLTNCDNGIAGDKYKGDVVITYSLVGSSLIKKNVGEIVAQIP